MYKYCEAVLVFFDRDAFPEEKAVLASEKLGLFLWLHPHPPLRGYFPRQRGKEEESTDKFMLESGL